MKGKVTTPAIKAGDVIRLRQSFCPGKHSQAIYSCGIVAGLVYPEDDGDVETPGEVVVQLFDPVSKQIYRDASGHDALFSFYFNEIEASGP